jgi:hypothetical protein
VELENPIKWRMGKNVLVRWTLALVATTFIGVVAYFLTRDPSPRPDFVQLITAGGLMVLGAGTVFGLLAWAVSATRTARHYGNAELELETVPVPLGGRLRGRIRANAALAPDQALNLILQCEASDLGGGESGGGSHVKWESEQLLTPADVEQRDGHLLVPIDLVVPGTQPPSGKDRRHEYSWTLIVSLEPRSGYAPRFPFPVVRTAESPPEPEKEPEPAIGIVAVMDKVSQLATYAKDGTLAAAAATWHQDPPMERPPHARVEILPRTAGGVEVVVPRTRATLANLLWFLLTLPLWVLLPARALEELQAIDSPPLIAYLLYCGLGFGIPLLLNGLAAVSLAWQTRRLQVGTDGVTVQRRLGSRTHPPGKFTTATALGDTTQGWSVHLKKSEAALLGSLPVAALRTQSEARWLAAELRRALGVKPPAQQ